MPHIRFAYISEIIHTIGIVFAHRVKPQGRVIISDRKPQHQRIICARVEILPDQSRWKKDGGGYKSKPAGSGPVGAYPKAPAQIVDVINTKECEEISISRRQPRNIVHHPRIQRACTKRLWKIVSNAFLIRLSQKKAARNDRYLVRGKIVTNPWRTRRSFNLSIGIIERVCVYQLRICSIDGSQR